MKKNNDLIVLPLIFCLLFPNGLAAQDGPAGSEIGSEHQRFSEEQVSAEREEKAREKTSTEVEEDESVSVPSTTSGVRFRMNNITITGNESIPASELQPFISQLMNRDVNLEEIQMVVTKIKNYYRSRGFISVYVYVPPQKIEQGIVEIRVIEGKLGEIEIVGNKWYSSAIIGDKIQLEEGELIQNQKLRDSLARLHRNKDIKAKAVLKPGKVENTTDVQIQVVDKFPGHVSADVNNLGTDNTGKTRWGFGAKYGNLLGRMDQLSGRFQIGKRSWAVGSDYYMPINSHDTRLGFAYQHSDVDLGGPFKDLDIEGNASTYSPYISHPLYDTEKFSALVMSSFDFKEIINKVSGEVAGRDRLRNLNLGLNLEQSDKYGKTFFPHTFTFGFSGASDKIDEGAIRTGTGGQYFIYKNSFVRYTRLPKDMTFLFRNTLQLSPDRLPPSEQFRLGGNFTVRGYEEGEFLADYGDSFSTELFIPTYFFPEDWKCPFTKEPLRKKIQGTAFFDFGAGKNRRAAPGERDERTLAGFGGGIRVHLFDKVYGRFEWARPVGDTQNDGDKSAFYFGVSVELF